MTGVPIKREDIRKGDRILSTFTEEFIAKSDTIASETGFTFELLERPVVLPTERGVYFDKDGDVWNWDETKSEDYLCPEFAPYTLLRPVAEVAAEVLTDVRGLFGSALVVSRIDAIAAKWATK